MNGYWNKILHVNLSDRTTRVEEPGDAFFRRYAGGRGLIAHYLLQHVPRGAEPLGPHNILIFAPGGGKTIAIRPWSIAAGMWWPMPWLG